MMDEEDYGGDYEEQLDRANRSWDKTILRHNQLKKLVESFIEEVDTMDLMKDPAVRTPASKHQRIIKQLYDLVMGFKHNYIRLNEGTKDD